MKFSLLQFASFATLFAQVSAPTSTELVATLGALLLVATLVLTIMNIVRREPKRRILPDPLRFSNVENLATINQLDQVEQQFDKRVDKLEDKMDRRFDDVFKAIDREGKRVDARINDVLTSVSKVQGAFDQSQRRRHEHE